MKGFNYTSHPHDKKMITMMQINEPCNYFNMQMLSIIITEPEAIVSHCNQGNGNIISLSTSLILCSFGDIYIELFHVVDVHGGCTPKMTNNNRSTRRITSNPKPRVASPQDGSLSWQNRFLFANGFRNEKCLFPFFYHIPTQVGS